MMALIRKEITALDNFYESLRWSKPGMAALMHDDLVKVTLGGASGNHIPYYPAVIRLRQQCLSLSTGMAKMFDYVLTHELGYSLEHIEQLRQTEVALETVRNSRRIHGV